MPKKQKQPKIEFEQTRETVAKTGEWSAVKQLKKGYQIIGFSDHPYDKRYAVVTFSVPVRPF